MNLTFEEQVYIAIGILFLTVIVCFVLLLILSSKYSKLKKKFSDAQEDPLLEVESKDFFEGGEPQSTEDIQSKIDEIAKNIDELQAKQQKAFDKIKVLRYNQTLADGSPSDMFSIGITNQMLEGIVLTGAETKEGATNIVVKSVKNGVSNIELTEAEQVAVTRKGEKK